MRMSKSTAIFAAVFLLVLLLSPFASFAAENQSQVAMRIGQHGSYTRVVFDFPKLTAYYADAENGDIALTFDTPSEILISAAKSSHILGIKKEKAAADSQKILIDIPSGATFKHYRLLRKVVVDIYAASTQTAAAAPAKPKPEEKPPEIKPEIKKEEPKTAEPQPVTIAAVEPPKEEKPQAIPAPAQTLTPEELKKAAPVEQVSAEKIPAAVAQEEPVAAEEEPTKITISTVEPTLLSVFTRFGTLWIVMDSKAAGAISPDIKGPQAGFIGKPKILKFDDGVAYRYIMPPKHHLSVSKRSLTWEIAITKAKQQAPTNAQLSVVFDEGTHKAKLMAELKGAGKVMELEDPLAGDKLYIVPASMQDARIDQPRRFADVEIIPAAIGLVVRPLKDGIKMNRIENFVMITSQDGIIATPGASSGPVLINEDENGEKEKSRLFDFPNWRQGGLAKLNENRRALENRLAAVKTPEEKSEVLMKLALLYFSNNLGHETLGVLRLIEMEDEEMPKNPNFIAVRGAASALAGQYPEAIRDLSNPALQQHPEITLWTGYAAAATEQWHMADRSFPKDNYYLVEYPQNIAIPFTIYMAESALRLGNTDTGNRLLQSLDTMADGDEPHYRAAISYLKGEAARQDGAFDEAIRLWTPVSHGLDRLYHAKASLALANLLLQEKRTTLPEAIDTIDSLRFAWRGDGLEVQILSTLGQLKIQNRQFLEGLQDLKAATVLASSQGSDPKPIEDDMTRTVFDLFAGDGAKDMSPLEAVSIYNEFEKYLPAGKDGMTAALHFADYLIRMDLLEKAAGLLEEQISGGLLEGKTADVGAKLAAAYLLDNKPSKAISALGKTATAADGKTLLERSLLKARAQSQLNLTDEAIATLSPLGSDDATRLKADVLWRARRWTMAAETIESMLPPPTSKLDDDGARLVVNAAVAWKLAGDSAHLLSIKQRYQSAMSATPLDATFGVVTRDGGNDTLSDRDSILKVAGEVDMFKGFLDSYKSASGKGS